MNENVCEHHIIQRRAKYFNGIFMDTKFVFQLNFLFIKIQFVYTRSKGPLARRRAKIFKWRMISQFRDSSD